MKMEIKVYIAVVIVEVWTVSDNISRKTLPNIPVSCIAHTAEC
jgi:hypothetical protein